MLTLAPLSIALSICRGAALDLAGAVGRVRRRGKDGGCVISLFSLSRLKTQVSGEEGARALASCLVEED